MTLVKKPVSGSVATGVIDSKPIVLDPGKIMVNAIISAATFRVARAPGEWVAEKLGLSSVGRSATKVSTFVESILDSSAHPKAAWQVATYVSEQETDFAVQYLQDKYVPSTDPITFNIPDPNQWSLPGPG